MASSSKSVPEHTISRLKSGDGEPAGLSGLARFGPVYGANSAGNLQKARDSAWKHIVEKSGMTDDEAEMVYMRSIAEVEKQTLNCYDPELKLKKGIEFRRMMVKDGCFFIQLALHILGGRELLGYPEQHPYLGKGRDSDSWIPAMFFAGNQIPCVVISALMKQTFFVNVIKEGSRRGTWQRRTEDLAKLVLYRTVVEPELGTPTPYFKSPPSNILLALHAMLLGPGEADPIYSEMKEFRDLEAGLDDSQVKFPSAGELHKLGITLRKAKTSHGSGIANIHFRNRVFWAFLDVAPLTIDAHTKDLLTSLAKHEQRLSESDREVTAYLRFMRDLAHTYKDFKILQNKGIIQVKDETLKRETVQMLNNIVTDPDHKCSFTLNFRQTRRMITGYGGPPWRIISIALALLTIVQTIFTVLSYFIPRT